MEYRYVSDAALISEINDILDDIDFLIDQTTLDSTSHEISTIGQLMEYANEEIDRVDDPTRYFQIKSRYDDVLKKFNDFLSTWKQYKWSVANTI